MTIPVELHDQKSMIQICSVPANMIRVTGLSYFKLDILQDIDSDRLASRIFNHVLG